MAIVAHVMAVFVKICWDKKWLEYLHFAVWGTVLGAIIVRAFGHIEPEKGVTVKALTVVRPPPLPLKCSCSC